MLFGLLALLLWRGFALEDPHRLPSVLIGKPFPEFSLPKLDGTGQATRLDMLGKIALVNVWATWCPTCFAEHQALTEIIKTTGLPLYGINYKDDPEKARQWLAKLGNPYVFNLMDAEGRLGVDLGVYGAPETFLIDAAGVIRYKRVGDVNQHIWLQEIMPAIESLTAAP